MAAKRATILDAVVRVLEEKGEAMSADAIYAEITSKSLYEFGAKDPPAMVRAAVRKHLRRSGNRRVTFTSDGRISLA